MMDTDKTLQLTAPVSILNCLTLTDGTIDGQVFVSLNVNSRNADLMGRMQCAVESKDNILHSIMNDNCNGNHGIFIRSCPISFVITSFNLSDDTQGHNFCSIRDERKSKYIAKPLSLTVIQDAYKWLTGCTALPENITGDAVTLRGAFNVYFDAMKKTTALSEVDDADKIFTFINQRNWPEGVVLPETTSPKHVLRKFIQDHFSQMTKIAASPFDGMHRTAALKICSEGTFLNNIDNDLKDQIKKYSEDQPHIRNNIHSYVLFELLTEEVSDDHLEGYRKKSIDSQQAGEVATPLGIFMYLGLVMDETQKILTSYHEDWGVMNDHHCLLSQLDKLMSTNELGRIKRCDINTSEEMGAIYDIADSPVLSGLFDTLANIIIKVGEDKTEQTGQPIETTEVRGPGGKGKRRKSTPEEAAMKRFRKKKDELLQELYEIMYHHSKKSTRKELDVAREHPITMTVAVQVLSHVWTKAVLCCMKLALSNTEKYTPRHLPLLNKNMSQNPWLSVTSEDLQLHFKRATTYGQHQPLYPIPLIISDKRLSLQLSSDLFHEDFYYREGTKKGLLNGNWIDLAMAIVLSLISKQSYATIKKCTSIKREETKQVRGGWLGSERRWLRLLLHSIVSSTISSREVYLESGLFSPKSRSKNQRIRERISSFVPDLFLVPSALECTGKFLHMLGQNPVIPNEMPQELDLNKIAQKVYSGVKHELNLESEFEVVPRKDLLLFLKNLCHQDDNTASNTNSYDYLSIIVVSFLVHHLPKYFTSFIAEKSHVDKVRVLAAQSIAKHLFDLKVTSGRAEEVEQHARDDELEILSNKIKMDQKGNFIGISVSEWAEGGKDTHSLLLHPKYRRPVPCHVLAIIQGTEQKPLFTARIHEWYREQICNGGNRKEWFNQVLETICLTYITQKLPKRQQQTLHLISLLPKAQADHDRSDNEDLISLFQSPRKTNSQQEDKDEEYEPSPPRLPAPRRSPRKSGEVDKKKGDRDMDDDELETGNDNNTSSEEARKLTYDNSKDDDSVSKEGRKEVEEEEEEEQGEEEEEEEEGKAGVEEGKEGEVNCEGSDEGGDKEYNEANEGEEGEEGSDDGGDKEYNEANEGEEGEEGSDEGGDKEYNEANEGEEGEEGSDEGGDKEYNEANEGEEGVYRRQEYSNVSVSPELSKEIDVSIGMMCSPRLGDEEPQKNALPTTLGSQKNGVITNINAICRKKKTDQPELQGKLKKQKSSSTNVVTSDKMADSINPPISPLTKNDQITDVLEEWSKYVYPFEDGSRSGESLLNTALDPNKFDVDEAMLQVYTDAEKLIVERESPGDQISSSIIMEKDRIILAQQAQIVSAKQSLLEFSSCITNLKDEKKFQDHLFLMSLKDKLAKPQDVFGLVNDLLSEENSMMLAGTKRNVLDQSQSTNSCTSISILLSLLWIMKDNKAEHQMISIMDQTKFAIDHGEMLHGIKHHFHPDQHEKSFSDMGLVEGWNKMKFVFEDWIELFPPELEEKTIDAISQVQLRNKLFLDFGSITGDAALCILHGFHTFTFLKRNKKFYCIDTRSSPRHHDIGHHDAYIQEFDAPIQIVIHMLAKVVIHIMKRVDIEEKSDTVANTSFSYLLIKPIQNQQEVNKTFLDFQRIIDGKVQTVKNQGLMKDSHEEIGADETSNNEGIAHLV